MKPDLHVLYEPDLLLGTRLTPWKLTDDTLFYPNFIQAALTREFNGKFKPNQLIVVTAEISNKGNTKTVDWAITKGTEIQDVRSQAKTSFDMNDAGNSATASIALPAGTLTSGSDYMIKAMMFDMDGVELSSSSTKITIYKEITGCRVRLQGDYSALSQVMQSLSSSFPGVIDLAAPFFPSMPCSIITPGIG